MQHLGVLTNSPVLGPREQHKFLVLLNPPVLTLWPHLLPCLPRGILRQSALGTVVEVEAGVVGVGGVSVGATVGFPTHVYLYIVSLNTVKGLKGL